MSEGDVLDPGAPIRLAAGREFELVQALIAAAAAPARTPLPAGDDAAVLAPTGDAHLVVSTDMVVEEVHFRRAWTTWEVVGHRATAAALSDLAAMAATPIGALGSLALPPELGREVAAAIGSGMGACLRAHRAALLGGDLTRSPGPVVLDVLALGTTDRVVARGDAASGDGVWVTGELGAAAAAVADLSRSLEPDPRARRAYERPTPRIREARWLAERVDLGALIDISDGIAGDAAQVAAASEVRLDLELETIPVAEPLLGYPNQEVALRLAVGGGEDYELLFTARSGSVEAVRDAFETRFGLPLTRVGRVAAGKGVRWLDADGAPVSFTVSGWNHFSPDPGGFE